MELHKLSARKLRELFVQGKYSSLEIVEYFLERIEKYDKKIGAFITVLKDRSIKKAKELDKKRELGNALGRLAGVPIAIKDNIHMKGEITSCASKFLTNYKAPFDSTLVRLLEEEDAILIGKTNLDEFAMGTSVENSGLQMTYNPWDLTRVPGGSSGGSAAAVAARLCPIAFGSDTGGSIRLPASFCGVLGFKPTYGRVSRYGLVAFGSSLDQIGPISNYAEDIALIMEIIGKHCDKDATSANKSSENYLSDLNSGIKGLKIGVPYQFLKDLPENSTKIFQDSLEKLESLGAQIVDIDLSILKHGIAVYYILATAEASTNLARFDGIRYGKRSKSAKTLKDVYQSSKQEGFGAEVKRRIILGTYVLSAGYQDAYYRKAQKVRALIIEKYKEIFEKCDLVSMPVAPFGAFKTGDIHDPLQMYLLDIYTVSSNLAGLPAMSVPAGFTDNNMPFGLQLIGPQLQDKLVCKAASAFEEGLKLPEWME